LVDGLSNTSGGTWSDDLRLTNDSASSWYPGIGADPSQKNLYVVWSDNRDGNGEIYYKEKIFNVSIVINSGKSDKFFDPKSDDVEEKEAKIWYDIEPSDFSGSLSIKIYNKDGLVISEDLGEVNGGEGNTLWDEMIDGGPADPTKNPYRITLLLFKDEEEVARSNEHKVWVGRPVLLVHGIYSSGRMWDTSMFGDEFIVETIDLTPNNGDILYLATLLKDKIQRIKEKYGVKKVDIVAHSMGGLVSRGCITHFLQVRYELQKSLYMPGYNVTTNEKG
jgi:hypothetical protein